jgi:hypothetical protein
VLPWCPRRVMHRYRRKYRHPSVTGVIREQISTTLLPKQEPTEYNPQSIAAVVSWPRSVQGAVE